VRSSASSSWAKARRSSSVLAVAALVFLCAAAAAQATIRPLTAAQRRAVVVSGNWHSGCPVTFADLRVLTVRYRGFDGRAHRGQLIVNRRVAGPLQTVFRKLYALRFPIRHMRLSDTYGARKNLPPDGDFTASFECRQASASPCGGLGNKRTGTWSMHAYGEAIDLNPVENPYVGCGMTRDKTALSYVDRSRHRRGMVTPAVIAAFASIGWGWGGAWTGATKDYMHVSANGH
jgi:hypothetical protein